MHEAEAQGKYVEGRAQKTTNSNKQTDTTKDNTDEPRKKEDIGQTVDKEKTDRRQERKDRREKNEERQTVKKQKPEARIHRRPRCVATENEKQQRHHMRQYRHLK